MPRIVIEFEDGAPSVETTLGEFLRDNEGFDDSEVNEIKAAVKARDTYIGGGGAEPAYKIRRA